jgi:hypothetical protein
MKLEVVKKNSAGFSFFFSTIRCGLFLFVLTGSPLSGINAQTYYPTSPNLKATSDKDEPHISISTASLVIQEPPKANTQEYKTQTANDASAFNNSESFSLKAGSYVANDSGQVEIVKAIGLPPSEKMRQLHRKNAKVNEISGTAVILPSVPAYYWSFGCSPTSAAMLAGYYDNMGYPYIYIGPTNNGVMPMTNEVWGFAEISGESWGQCPLSATKKGLDGQETYGHVDDYWIKSYSFDPDPYTTLGRKPHTDDCVADFMKTSQVRYSNPDGGTAFQFGSKGCPYTGNDISDGGFGLQLFFESRGYEVERRFNQYIQEYQGYGTRNEGFTFGQYVEEINAGRPVLIHLDDHTTVGVGYELSDSTIYIHDTWDYLTHQLKWGGSYFGHLHTGVTVVQLMPSNTVLVKNNGSKDLIIKSISSDKGWLSISEKYVFPLIVAPGESKDLTVSIQWEILGEDEQNGNLTIFSNDPDEPQKTIAVSAVPHKCVAIDAPGIWMDLQPDCNDSTGSVTLENLPQTDRYSILNTTTNQVIEGGGSMVNIENLLPGTYSFVVIDRWGCTSTESPKVVIRSQPHIPVTPRIELVGSVLHSSSTSGNQWYNQDGIISGARSSQYEVKKSGSYYVIVASEYCYSDPSNTIAVNLSNSIQTYSSEKIKLVPNPATEIISIAGLNHNAYLQLFDLNGKLILAKEIADKEPISVGSLHSGIYVVQIFTEKYMITEKLIKN